MSEPAYHLDSGGRLADSNTDNVDVHAFAECYVDPSQLGDMLGSPPDDAPASDETAFEPIATELAPPSPAPRRDRPLGWLERFIIGFRLV